MLTLIPVSLAQANEFVRQHHRHHKPVAGHKFSIGCSENGRLYTVHGEGLRVGRLAIDTGELAIDGAFDALDYTEETASGGFWSRLFGG